MSDKKERVIIYSAAHAAEILDLVSLLDPDQRLRLICRSRPDSLLALLAKREPPIASWELLEQGPKWWSVVLARVADPQSG